MPNYEMAERFEKIFLGISAGMLVIFLGALLYASVAMGISVPSAEGTIDVSTVRTTAPFDTPGVRETGPNQYEVTVLAQAWAFVPNEIRIPAGAEVTFVMTSADVLHGFNVEGTRLNLMLIPGQVTRFSYTFDEPGEHIIICHEYCGTGHHAMSGKVIVE